MLRVTMRLARHILGFPGATEAPATGAAGDRRVCRKEYRAYCLHAPLGDERDINIEFVRMHARFDIEAFLSG